MAADESDEALCIKCGVSHDPRAQESPMLRLSGEHQAPDPIWVHAKCLEEHRRAAMSGQLFAFTRWLQDRAATRPRRRARVMTAE